MTATFGSKERYKILSGKHRALFVRRTRDFFNNFLIILTETKMFRLLFFLGGLDTIPAMVTWKRFVVLSFALIQYIFKKKKSKQRNEERKKKIETN